MSFLVAARHRSMSEAEKGQRSSLRVPRPPRCPPRVVSKGSTSAPMHPPSSGTEECPGWEATL